MAALRLAFVALVLAAVTLPRPASCRTIAGSATSYIDGQAVVTTAGYGNFPCFEDWRFSGVAGIGDSPSTTTSNAADCATFAHGMGGNFSLYNSAAVGTNCKSRKTLSSGARYATRTTCPVEVATASYMYRNTYGVFSGYSAAFSYSDIFVLYNTFYYQRPGVLSVDQCVQACLAGFPPVPNRSPCTHILWGYDGGCYLTNAPPNIYAEKGYTVAAVDATVQQSIMDQI